MKIAHLFISFPNKFQKYNIKLLERLEKSGIEVYPFTLDYNDKIKSPFVVISLKVSKLLKLKIVLSNLTLFYKFKKKYNYSYKRAYTVFTKFFKLTTKKYDVLHVHHIQVLSQEMLNFIDFFQLKTLLSLRGSDVLIRPYRSELEFEFVKNVFKVIKYAHTVSDDLKSNLTIYNLKDENIYSIKRTPEVLHKVKKKENEFFNITTIGRIHWTKGLIPTLIVLSEIIKEIKKPIKFHICGSGNEEEIDEIKCWIRILKLNDVVILHDYLDNDKIDELLSYTNVYIQPSVSEGIPNTLLRVLYSEILIIASKVGGIPEIISHGENGYLFDWNNLNDFHTLLKNAINGDINKENLTFKSKDFENNIEVSNYHKMYLEITNSR